MISSFYFNWRYSIQAITGHSSEAQLRRYLKLDAEEKAVIALKDFKGIIKI